MTNTIIEVIEGGLLCDLLYTNAIAGFLCFGGLCALAIVVCLKF